MRQSANLMNGSIIKGLIFFALPLLLSNLFQQLYNAVDSAVVGTYAGEVSLAAVGGTAALINLLIGFFLGIATGTGVLYALRYGASDWKGLKKICDAAIFLSAVSAAAITLFGMIFTTFLLKMTRMPENVISEATVYLRIYLAGTIPNLLYNVAAGMIRAKGDSTRPLLYLGLSGVTNLLLDLLFVAVLKMGAAGAALATILAQILSCVLSMGYLMRLPEEYRFRPFSMHLDGAAIRDVIHISVPCGLQSAMFNISNLLVQVRINSFGSTVMAGTTAYGKLDGFIYMPTGALSLTVSTYVGQNIGARHLDRVRRGIRLCLLLSLTVAVCMETAVIVLFRPAIGLFTNHEEVVAVARQEMWYLAPFAWIFIFSDILGGAMRGAGEATPVMFISALCICVFRIIWLTLVLHFYNDIRVVYLVYPISWTLSSVAMAAFYFCRSRLRTIMGALQKQPV